MWTLSLPAIMSVMQSVMVLANNVLARACIASSYVCFCNKIIHRDNCQIIWRNEVILLIHSISYLVWFNMIVLSFLMILLLMSLHILSSYSTLGNFVNWLVCANVLYCYENTIIVVSWQCSEVGREGSLHSEPHVKTLINM